MKLLTDQDLYARIANPTPPARPLIEPTPQIMDWFAKDSPVQPCSIDLHIGKIYVPGRKKKIDGEPIVHEEYVLRTGETAIIITLERLILSSDLAAIGFPPSRVSIQGLLMTNPGHVDPGYDGPMHLTVINMGKDAFALRKGDLIVTVLIFELFSPPHADWQTRNGPPQPDQAPSALDKLAPDFVNVERRATSIASNAVKRAALLGTVLGAVVAGVLSFAGLSLQNYFGKKLDVEQVKGDLAALEKRTEQQLTIEKQLASLDHRITLLEAHSSVSSGSGEYRKGSRER